MARHALLLISVLSLAGALFAAEPTLDAHSAQPEAVGGSALQVIQDTGGNVNMVAW